MQYNREMRNELHDKVAALNLKKRQEAHRGISGTSIFSRSLNSYNRLIEDESNNAPSDKTSIVELVSDEVSESSADGLVNQIHSSIDELDSFINDASKSPTLDEGTLTARPDNKAISAIRTVKNGIPEAAIGLLDGKEVHPKENPLSYGGDTTSETLSEKRSSEYRTSTGSRSSQLPEGDSTSQPSSRASGGLVSPRVFPSYVYPNYINFFGKSEPLSASTNAFARVGDTQMEVSLRLLAACRLGDWPTVRDMLESADGKNDYDLNVSDEHGYTPLLLCVRGNQQDIVDKLTILGASLNAVTKDGLNALHIAAMAAESPMNQYLMLKNTELVFRTGNRGELPLHILAGRKTENVRSMLKLLLSVMSEDELVDPRMIADNNGAVPLHYSINNESVACTLELLMKNGPEQTNRQTKDTRETPLHVAIRFDNEQLTRILLSHSPNVNLQNAKGETVLHYAVKNVNEPLLRALQALGADADIADKDSKTPLFYALEDGNTAATKLLIGEFSARTSMRSIDGSTLLHIAAELGNEELSALCLEHDVLLEMPNKEGSSALHTAATFGHVPVIRLLARAGAKLHVVDKEGYCALHVAVMSGEPGAIEALIGYGADVMQRAGPLKETALHLAAALPESKAISCADVLLKSGADVNVSRMDGKTSLHICAMAGNHRLLNTFLREQGDATAVDNNGQTALVLAVRQCHPKVVQALIRHFAVEVELHDYVNIKCKAGLTATHYAALIENRELVDSNDEQKILSSLMEAGGDVNLMSPQNETVMHYAARNGKDQLLKLLVDKMQPDVLLLTVNRQTKIGWSSIMEACSQGHYAIVDILLQRDARTDVFDAEGRTALHLAAAGGHPEVCRILLEHKAYVNSKNRQGEASLHLAAMDGHSSVIELLLKSPGAEIETTTSNNQTALHYAAKHGQVESTEKLLALGANANAKDSQQRTPLHLVAESNYSEVVYLFLKLKTKKREVLTAVDENGFTSAHIAALQGSLDVMKELMSIDKEMVTEAKTKTTGATALHLATDGGHEDIVTCLVENGADYRDENLLGLTPLHVAAQHGHVQLIAAFTSEMWQNASTKTGITPIHVAAFYGQRDFVREIVNIVPASTPTVAGAQPNPLVVREFARETGFTALHKAAHSGNQELVRILLNVPDVQVDQSSDFMHIIPLHLAAYSGHLAVAAMLISRSATQLNNKDSSGRTALHFAAMNNHGEMLVLLLSQGSHVNAQDVNGWTPMHHAAQAGHLEVLALLMAQNADPSIQNRQGKLAMSLAANHSRIASLAFLIEQKHDTIQLIDDKAFLFDLMVCGKTNTNESIQKFVLRSPAPVYTAVKLSDLYKDFAEREKERASDLMKAWRYCESMAVDLMSIASSEYNSALLLRSRDSKNRSFLDVLIDSEQKNVVAHASVQGYLTEIFMGGIEWSDAQFALFFLCMLLCPPIWVFVSLPLDRNFNRAPINKFMCHVVSHVFLTVVLSVIVLGVFYPIYSHGLDSYLPDWLEIVWLFWLGGVLVSELSARGGRSGLGMVRLMMLFVGGVAIVLHVLAYTMPQFMAETKVEQERILHDYLYLKNQMFGFMLLFASVQYLDYMQMHYLFGPWAIIIRDLIVDLLRFLAILFLFVTAFTVHITSIYRPAYREATVNEMAAIELASPLQTFEMLFFALFGLVEPDQMPPMHLVPAFSKYVMKLVFGIYMTTTLIVLINLLIAMMSDTYHRIHVQSDMEWKFGRAILIRQMNKRTAVPSPINLFTKSLSFLRVAWANKFNICNETVQRQLKREEDVDSYSVKINSVYPEGKNGSEQQKEGDNTEVALDDPLSWKIETVLPWHRVVTEYTRMQGISEVDE